GRYLLRMPEQIAYTMNNLTKILSFLSENGYRVLKHMGLGTTSHVFIIEKKKTKYALKIARDDHTQANSLELEYNIMKYLSTNEMSCYLPVIEDWIGEINGFLMEYLEYPKGSNRGTMLLMNMKKVKTHW
ncbi:unnamed protein product, partial [marine sediment metagenome]